MKEVDATEKACPFSHVNANCCASKCMAWVKQARLKEDKKDFISAMCATEDDIEIIPDSGHCKLISGR